jgi:SAM-dependent MidA family methyltransferase
MREDQIRREIQRDGPITFARFMELALYAPGLGYYERKRDIGRRGDFFTSVSVGPLFGQLLAFQFAQWLDAACPSGGVQLVEAGPHNGALAADILAWMGGRRPDLFERLEYVLLDASPARRPWQEATLRARLPKVKWAANIAALGRRRVNGIIFSNEFLDALPVHRLSWSAAARQWREWRVSTDGEGLGWERHEPSAELAARLPRAPRELAEVLPEGFALEICPAAEAWWRAAAGALRTGKLLSIDYGFADGEWFRPERAPGTLRAFSRHHASADLLSRPGEQDLTAHVDFFVLEETGEAAGLRTEVLARQSKFLTKIFAGAGDGAFAPWDGKKIRQFQTLTHPEHLGERFQVLIQERQLEAIEN